MISFIYLLRCVSIFRLISDMHQKINHSINYLKCTYYPYFDKIYQFKKVALINFSVIVTRSINLKLN